MKMTHKINHGWFPTGPTDRFDAAYERELAETLRKVEKRHRVAQKRLALAERLADLRPEPRTLQELRDARTDVLARLGELREIEALMRRQVPSGRHPVRIVNKRGSEL